MKKIPLPRELSFFLGLAILAIGTACMYLANFGMSTVVAPAFVLQEVLHPHLPFLTPGMANYTIQALLLVLMCCILGKFRTVFLLSFVSGFLNGIFLDIAMWAFSSVVLTTVPQRLLFFFLGLVLCSLGIAFVLESYFAPEVYELFVEELTVKFRWNFPVVKTAFDLSCCLLAIAISFIGFGLWEFRDIGWGTLVSAGFNGLFIGLFSRLFSKIFAPFDALPLRKYLSPLEEADEGHGTAP